MKNRIIFNLLALLSSKEWNEFEAWLEIELNEGKKKRISIITLGFKKGLSESEMWQMIKPDVPFKDELFRKYCNEATEHLEDFLRFIALKNKDIEKDLILLKYINRTYLDSDWLFDRTYNRIQRKLQKIGIKDSYYFRYQFQLAAELQHRQVRSSQNAKPFRLEVFKDWERWVIHEMLLLYFIENYQYDTKDFMNHSLDFEEVIHMAKTFVSHDTPALDLLISIIESTKGKESPELVSQFRENVKHVHKETASNLFLLLINQFNSKLDTVRPILIQNQLISLYEYGIESSLILINDILPFRAVRNLIQLYTITENPAGIQKCLNEYIQLIENDQRDFFTHFGEAHLLYAGGCFKKAEKYILQMISQEPDLRKSDYVMIRGLLIETLYELREEEDMKTQIHSLQVHLKNQKFLPKSLTDKLLIKMQYILEILRLSKAESKEGLERLLNKLSEPTPVAGKVWLTKKIQQKIDLF